MNPTAWDLICLGLVCAGLGAVVGALTNNKRESNIMATKVSQLAEKLGELTVAAQLNEERLGKVVTEVKGLREDFDKLKESLGDVEIPGLAQELLDNLTNRIAAIGERIKEVDEVNPDAPTPETPANG